MLRTISACGLAVLAIALGGCGGGVTVAVAGDQAVGGRAVPLVGFYNGGLLNFGVRNALEYTLQRDGVATGVVRLLDSGQRLELVGRVTPDRVLVLSNSELRIEGTFSGSYNPNSPSEYIRGGVLFYGTWVLQSGGSGRVEAAHETWPPPPNYSGGGPIYYDDDDDDPWYEDPYPTGGGSGGSYDPPSGGGFDPGTPSGDSPPATGGEPTNDDIIYRREVELG